MAGLCAPLSTLRRCPRGHLRMTRGRCGSLLLHRDGLAPSTPCRSPGALRSTPKNRHRDRPSACLKGADFVAKVENPTKPKISRKSIPRHRCRCEAPWRRYEGPWSFWRETIWSLTSRGARRISGSENFGSAPQKYFCNKICQLQTHAPQQATSLFDYLVGAVQ